LSAAKFESLLHLWFVIVAVQSAIEQSFLQDLHGQAAATHFVTKHMHSNYESRHQDRCCLHLQGVNYWTQNLLERARRASRATYHPQNGGKHSNVQGLPRRLPMANTKTSHQQSTCSGCHWVMALHNEKSCRARQGQRQSVVARRQASTASSLRSMRGLSPPETCR
jgi:hypothetical protein